MTTPDPRITAGGDVSDEELAAVMAAVELVLRGAGDGGGWPLVDEVPRWRFSGRWWSKPVPARRDRPF